MAQEAYTTRHWRARLRLTFADDPRNDPPTITRHYCAWVSADDEAEASALVTNEVDDFEDLLRTEVTELVEVTSGGPEVIALWEDR